MIYYKDAGRNYEFTYWAGELTTTPQISSGSQHLRQQQTNISLIYNYLQSMDLYKLLRQDNKIKLSKT